MSTKIVDQGEAVIGFNYQAQVDSKTVIVFQAHVSRDCRQEELDDAVDKLRLAHERQQKFSGLKGLKIDLENTERRIAAVKDEISRLQQRYNTKAQSYAGRGEYEGMTKPEEDSLNCKVDQMKNDEQSARQLREQIKALEIELGVIQSKALAAE
jgi:outer membrane murein-binding lipoprotein Lpp